MLRLHPYEYHRPTSLNDALALLSKFGQDAMPIAGGTDLVPNMKHGLFTPGHLVGLGAIGEMRGISASSDHIRIGACESLASVASNPKIRTTLPSLAQAAALISGPQLRRVGTIGGNICLDTRCTYYNQTRFWREALGYCLKKDGDACHVVKGGTRCVAAHSADTPPVLSVLDAVLEVMGAGGQREISIKQFFTSDGIWNRAIEPGDLIIAIRIPKPTHGTYVAFQKLRSRNAIDFPLANLAVRVEHDENGCISNMRIVASAMGAYPREIGKLTEAAVGSKLSTHTIDTLAEQVFRQCHPLDNITVDKEWRRAMLPVLLRRALAKIAVA